LTQTLVADLQLIGGDRQQDQSVLPHERDSSAHPKSLPR
jgi:hypothetical protein